MKISTTSHPGLLLRDLFPPLLSIAVFFAATATARADILYVSIPGPNTIEKFTSGGVGSVFANTGLSGPTGLAFDGAGDLFAANITNSTLEKFSSTGTDLGVFAIAGSGSSNFGLSLPVGLAFDSAGNLYAANGNDGRIEKYTPGGVASIFANTGLNGVNGLAFDSAGNLYAAGSNTIEEITPGGVGSVFASTGLNGATGLAFDSAGNLYAVNSGNNTIEKFTLGGVGSVFASTGLTLPQGLAFDSVGNLYVASGGFHGTIEQFSPTGTDLGVFANTGFSGPAYLAFTNDAGVPLPLLNQAPEPTTLALAAMGILALLSRNTRRRA